jgi:hypothetical protein
MDGMKDDRLPSAEDRRKSRACDASKGLSAATTEGVCRIEVTAILPSAVGKLEGLLN